MASHCDELAATRLTTVDSSGRSCLEPKTENFKVQPINSKKITEISYGPSTYSLSLKSEELIPQVFRAPWLVRSNLIRTWLDDISALEFQGSVCDR